MTYRQIEASREARLWISQVIVPIVTTAGAMMMVPEVRACVVDKATELKSKVKAKIKR